MMLYHMSGARVSHTISLIDGRTLSVTASIARALPYLANACQTGYLWIDQITIDQSNILERNDQVKIMGEIYSRSFQCWIWIDSDPLLDAESDIKLPWSHGTGEDVRKFFQSFSGDELQHLWQSTSGEEARKLLLLLKSPFTRPRPNVRDHVLWFLEHPWFSRTWVYQEFVLAPQPIFLIGDFQLPGHEIESVFKLGWPRSAAWFDTFHRRLNIHKTRAAMFHRAPGFEFLLAAFQSRILLNAPQSLGRDLSLASSRYSTGFAAYDALTYADMLEKMAASQSQNDRDHVYALIGLAPCLLKYMRVDYFLSVEETFAAMMKALVKGSGSLDFFGNLPSEADISKSKLRLPSWVSNWTVCAPNIHIMCHDNLFNAAGPGFGLPSVEKCKHFDPPTSAWNELMVAGKIIDTVLFKLKPFSVYQVTPNLDVDFNNCSGFLPWEMSTLNIFMAEMTERGFSQGRNISKKALLRTLLMDGVQWAAIAALTSGEPLYRTGQKIIGVPHHKKTEDVISALTESENPNLDDLPHGTTLHIIHELSKVQHRRRIACCANGRLALTPDWVEKGDKIAILHGSRVPVVLRARPDGNFIIVGQCYYDGAMYGGMADVDDNNADIFTLV